MRAFILSFVVLLIASPAFAADTAKPSIVKGTKSYQSRVVTSDEPSVQAIEPAAGAEIATDEKTNTPVQAAPSEDEASKPVMKLHGKK